MIIRREEILRRLHRNTSEGRPVTGTGVGAGTSTKFEEAGGTDLVIIYNSGRHRVAGGGSSAGLLVYRGINQIVMDMAGEILPVVKDTPVLAGASGMDPFKDIACLLKKVRDMGYSEARSFPTMGLFEGGMRQTSEETEMSYNLKVEMIRITHEMDLSTALYASNPSEAARMAKAGVDTTIVHCGYMMGDSIGAESIMDLDVAVKTVQEIHDAAASERSDIIALCHGGPISSLEGVEYVPTRIKGVHGSYGVSSAERLPVEAAIKGHIEKSKEVTL